jgi:hypothetical protein
MYGTNGPEGGELVVVGAVVVVPLVVVVAPEEVDGAVVVAPEELEGAVVVAPDEVESVVVVAPEEVDGVVVVVGPEVAPVDVDELSLAAAVDVVSLDVELEKVLPIVIGETSPSAPETSSPSANMAAMPTSTRMCPRREVRRFTQSSVADSADPQWILTLAANFSSRTAEHDPQHSCLSSHPPCLRKERYRPIG